MFVVLARTLAVAAVALAAVATPAPAQQRDRSAVVLAIDSVVASYLKDGKAAGMSVLYFALPNRLMFRRPLELLFHNNPTLLYKDNQQEKLSVRVAL